MMARFYGYIDKVFQFRDLTGRLTDSRPQPVIPTAAVFGTAFAMFATCRGSLNGIDQQRHFPGRLQNFVGPHVRERRHRRAGLRAVGQQRVARGAPGRPPPHQTQQDARRHHRPAVRGRGRPRVFSPAANAVATSARRAS